MNGTAAPKWGIRNDHGKLHEVLLGRPEYYRWVEAGPLIGRTLANADRTGHTFDHQLAMKQHAEMVAIYEENDVTCHYLEADEALHRNFFTRDSSAMTPWGPRPDWLLRRTFREGRVRAGRRLRPRRGVGGGRGPHQPRVRAHGRPHRASR